jgi:hypothetical protein
MDKKKTTKFAKKDPRHFSNQGKQTTVGSGGSGGPKKTPQKSDRYSSFPELNRLIAAHRANKDPSLAGELLAAVHAEQDKINYVADDQSEEDFPVIHISQAELVAKMLKLQREAARRSAGKADSEGFFTVPGRARSQHNTRKGSGTGSRDICLICLRDPCACDNESDSSIATTVVADQPFVMAQQIDEPADEDEQCAALLRLCAVSKHMSKTQYAEHKQKAPQTNQSKKDDCASEAERVAAAANGRRKGILKKEAAFKAKNPPPVVIVKQATSAIMRNLLGAIKHLSRAAAEPEIVPAVPITVSVPPFTEVENGDGNLFNRERRVLVCNQFKKHTIPWADFMGYVNTDPLLKERYLQTHVGLTFHSRDIEIELPATMVDELSAFFNWKPRTTYDDFQLCVVKAQKYCAQIQNLSSEMEKQAILYAPVLAWHDNQRHRQNAAWVLHNKHIGTIARAKLSCKRSSEGFRNGGWKYVVAACAAAVVTGVAAVCAGRALQRKYPLVRLTPQSAWHLASGYATVLGRCGRWFMELPTDIRFIDPAAFLTGGMYYSGRLTSVSK